MLRWSNIRRVLFLIAILLAAMQFSQSVTAQEEVAPARKFDEFEGLFSSCDYGAHLDNLAIELQNNPNADAYIICYGPEGGSGGGIYRLTFTKDYLVNTRGLDAARIKTLYGGRYKELKEVFTELWIVPPGASPPEPVTFENNVKTFTGMFDEYEHWEGPYDGEGIPRGNVTLAGFADVLRQQPETRVYIVVQNAKGATPGAWRRAARDVVVSLQDGYKVKAERINIIYAGYDADTKDESDTAKVQLWVLPQGAPPPVSEVTAPEPTPEKAIKWRSFSVYDLEDAIDKRRVFEDVADILLSDKGLSVCIIVRQESKAQENVQEDAEPSFTEMVRRHVENEPPNVYLMELAGNWKSDLAKDYGFSEQRFILLPAAAQEWDSNEMEIWFVPTGAALPDPDAQNVAESDRADDADEAQGTQQETPEAEPFKKMN